jgi:DNA repair exonuclease SbcCD ATPase subunit
LGREGLPVKRPPRPNPKDTLIIQQLKEEQTRYKELDRILKEEQKRRKELDLALKEEQKRRKELDGRILRLKQSVSYKLGRVLTFIPRKIKEML